MFQVCATSCPPTLFKCSILYSSDGLQQWRGWKTHSGQQTLETLREIHVATIISKFRLVIKMWHLSLLAKQIWLKMHLFGQSTNWNKNVSFTDSIHPPPTHPPTFIKWRWTGGVSQTNVQKNIFIIWAADRHGDQGPVVQSSIKLI